MEVHVKVLGAIFMVLGACGLLGALLLGMVFGGAAGLVGASGDPDAAIAVPIIGLTGMALVAFLVAMSLPGVVIGAGLLQFRSWARIGGIVLSILQLVWFPLGTVIGAYGLWVLLSAGSAPLFAGHN
jgi:hypothetical protein